MAGGGVAAALGPADDREEPDALLLEPGPLLPRRELQVGLGPLARPVVLGAVEAGGAEPVLAGQLQGVVHPQPALLRGVDEEQPAEGPPGLAAEGRLGLLVEEDHPLAGVGQLGGGDQAGQPRPHDDDVGLGAAALGAHGRDASGPTPPRAVPLGGDSPGGPGPLADRPPQREHQARPAGRPAGSTADQNAGPPPSAAKRTTSTSSASSGSAAATARSEPAARPAEEDQHGGRDGGDGEQHRDDAERSPSRAPASSSSQAR